MLPIYRWLPMVTHDLLECVFDMILKLCSAFVSGFLLTLGPSLTYTAVSWSAVLSYALVSVPFPPGASVSSQPAELPIITSIGYDHLQSLR
jgi:hypothetical protein